LVDHETRNLAAIQRGWDAFNAKTVTTDAIRAGELAEVFEAFDRGIVWDTTAVGIPGIGEYQGHRGVRQFWLDWFEVVGDVHTEVREMAAVGNKVVSICHQSASGMASGATVSWDFAITFTMRDGKAVRGDITLDLDEARRVVGLSTPAAEKA
jgi:ketosteroid isomerase-like protein